jgi:hypothetical protein
MADFVNEKAFGPFLLTQVSIKQKAVEYHAGWKHLSCVTNPAGVQ